MSDKIFKDKKWKDLKLWQKLLFSFCAGLFIFGLIYLPIEYQNSVGDYEVDDAMSGCKLYFDRYNLSEVSCPTEASLLILNGTGKLDKYYTINDYIEAYNAWVAQQQDEAVDFDFDQE